MMIRASYGQSRCSILLSRPDDDKFPTILQARLGLRRGGLFVCLGSSFAGFFVVRQEPSKLPRSVRLRQSAPLKTFVFSVKGNCRLPFRKELGRSWRRFRRRSARQVSRGLPWVTSAQKPIGVLPAQSSQLSVATFCGTEVAPHPPSAHVISLD